MTTDSVAATLALGFVLGLRHALDADHLVAVGTIVSREGSARRAYRVGLAWGAGHATALFVAAGAVLAVRRALPEGLVAALEAGVGVMLVALGADLLVRVARGARHPHVHDGEAHAHFRPGDSARPFVVGLVHGLAGSGALTLLVLSSIRSPFAALLYVALFGAGTLLGMAVMSALLAVPLTLAARRGRAMSNAIRVVAAVGSIAFGMIYAASAIKG